MPALGLWLLRNWKLVLGVLAVVGILGLFGVMRLELAVARLKGDQAATKTMQQTLRAEAAEAEVARQKGFVSELSAVNQRNAALMADYQKRLAMQQEAADKATQSLANLKRSYAVAIEEIRNAKQQAAPLSAPARSGLARLWCLQQRQGDFNACPGH